MLPRLLHPVLLPIGVGFVLGCQTIAGVEDKRLDPSLVDAADANALDVQPDGDAGLDAAVEAAVDSSEAAASYPPRPPDRPDSDAAQDDGGDAGRVLTFGVRRLYMGSIDPATDKRTTDAWREFGFDVDGICTTAAESKSDSSGVCQRPDASTEVSQEDGNDCRDNALGHVLADVMQFSISDFERTIHVRTQSGDAQTLIIQLLDVGDGSDDSHVPARIYVSAPTEDPPLWDGSDVLPVDESSVDGGLEQPKYVVEGGYIRDHVWVSGDYLESPLRMPLPLLDEVVEMDMDTAMIVIPLNPTNTDANHGMFGGVMDGAEVAPVVHRGVLEATDCNETLANMAVDRYLLPNRDLVSDAPGFVNPDVECDRQSFGAFFELVKVQSPEETRAVEPGASPCE